MFWYILLCFATPQQEQACVQMPVQDAETCNFVLYNVRRFAEIKGIKEYEVSCERDNQYT